MIRHFLFRQHSGVLRALACSFLLAVPTAASHATADLTLQLHEQRPWRAPANLERVAIADPDVADLVMLRSRGGREALLTGKRPGRTTLLLWHRGDASPQRFTVEVQAALQATLPEGGGLVVQDGSALLQGSTPSLLQHEQMHAAAVEAVGDKGNITDISTIASSGVVQVDVKVVEFNKTAMRRIGLNFDKSNGSGAFKYGIASPSGGNPLSSAFSLVARSVTHDWSTTLNLLTGDGMARVLAEPTLVALSGQSASFLAGGELPIPVPQGLGTTTINYKPFGIGLTVTPTVLAPDRIALKVAPEASDLDYANALVYEGVSVPAIVTRRADTTVELGDGETFVIGGLVSQTLSSKVNKIPLLGDIPVLGAFFRDLNYQREDKELVIMVTPHLVQPIASGTALPLPGQREAQPNHPVWGAWLIDPAGADQLPGFSR